MNLFSLDPKPVAGGRGNFKLLARTKEEEDAFDYVRHRNMPKPSGVVGSIAHLVKGSLGGGLLAGHMAYMKAGVLAAVPLNLIFGFYMMFCLHLLVQSAQVLCKRTRVPTMSYSDVGEAAMATFPNPKIARFSKVFRHLIEALICIDLFGACASYQLIIAKSIKQLVEDSSTVTMEGVPDGMPSLRIYMMIMILPIILICLIRHLKYLAPFSIGANVIICIAVIMSVYYASENNPNFENLHTFTTISGSLEFSGIIVFSMSCAGVVIPIENNMKNPKRFPFVLVIGMLLTTLGTIVISFFGYAAYLENSEAPITVNFPMVLGPKILKGGIAVMILITHALNFWPPFHLCFYYLKQLHPDNKQVVWELIYRTLFVLLVSTIAIVFPSINALMGFLGSFCLSNMAFIWPVTINLLVIWHRPGLGLYKWRLWRNLVLFIIGIFLLVCGSIVNTAALVDIFIHSTLEKLMA